MNRDGHPKHLLDVLQKFKIAHVVLILQSSEIAAHGSIPKQNKGENEWIAHIIFSADRTVTNRSSDKRQIVWGILHHYLQVWWAACDHGRNGSKKAKADKGLLNSELIFEVIVSPKNATEY